MVTFFLMILWLFHICFCMSCSRPCCILKNSTIVKILLWLKVTTFLCCLLYVKSIVILFSYLGHFHYCKHLLWVWLHSSSGYHFPKHQYLCTSRMKYIFIQFPIFLTSYLHYMSQGFVVISAISIIPCSAKFFW